ncbi:MAG: SusC/RagA family TonB-linked outer membrane protein [Cyclobacteriaceae bacterium]
MKKKLQSWLIMGSKFVLYGISLQLLFIGMLMSYDGTAQQKSLRETKLDLDVSQSGILNVLNTIEKQTEFKFFYDRNIINRSVKIDLHGELSLHNILMHISKEGSLKFRQIGNMINVAKHSPDVNTNTEPDYIEVLQAITITGKVTSLDTPEGLPGVNVVVKGTAQGTVTDMEGRYTLDVPGSESILVFSSVGYLTEEVVVGGRSVLNMDLTADITALEEIVVVGYGTQKRADITGSISSISSKSIQDMPLTGFDQAIAGQAAGVQVSQTSGAPGGGVSIRVRGTGSIGAGNEPLYVIDGFPVSNAFSQNANPLSTINPNDIESIEILKDASASSIYGSRGSNGVVLITTKKGVEGKAKFNLDVYTGVQQLHNKIDMMNAREFAEYTTETRNNAWLDFGPDIGRPRLASDPNDIRPSDMRIPPAYADPTTLGAGTDWQDEIFGNARITSYQLSASGGSKNSRYLISGGYLNQEGIMMNTGFERYAFRANVDTDITDRVKIGLNVAPSYSKHKLGRSEGAWNASAISTALAFMPHHTIFDDDGQYVDQVGYGYGMSADLFNPVALLREEQNQLERLRLLSNVYAELEIVKGLTFRTSFGADILASRQNLFTPNTILFSGQPPTAQAMSSRSLNWLNENTLTYDKDFNSKHSLNVLAGFTAQKFNDESSQLFATNFPNNVIRTLNAGQVTSGNSFITEWSLLSYLGRINYSFNSKYLFSAALRADGSSRFGQDTRWGYFPSISAGWRLSEENFYKNIMPELFSDLKLKASYGITGNFEIDNYQHIALLQPRNYILGSGTGEIATGIGPQNIGNVNLGWERTEQINLGVELGLFEDRISLMADYFINNTSDLLLEVPIPHSTGFTFALQNIGKVQNKGWEFTLNSRNIVGEFNWNTNFNITLMKNEVIALGPEGDPIFSSIGGVPQTHITQIGSPLGSFFGLDRIGVYQSIEEIQNNPSVEDGRPSQPGDFRFRDVNNDGRITADDRTILGKPNPDFIFGFTNTFTYKNFDLNILLQGVYGNQILNLQSRLAASAAANANLRRDLYVNSWRSPEQPGDGLTMRPNRLPSGRTTDLSSWHVEDGSFLRLRNIALGYSLPQQVLNNVKLSNVRFYVSVQNAFTWTNYKGYNPEVSHGGINPLTPGTDYGTYPLSTIYTAGLNIGF